MLIHMNSKIVYIAKARNRNKYVSVFLIQHHYSVLQTF